MFYLNNNMPAMYYFNKLKKKINFFSSQTTNSNSITPFDITAEVTFMYINAHVRSKYANSRNILSRSVTNTIVMAYLRRIILFPYNYE